MTTITRTEQAETITYTATIDGQAVSFLIINAATRKVCNIETAAAHRGEGHARNLWEAANAEADCFHDLDHHRTAEGDAFAQAVGGETISDEDGYVADCWTCAETITDDEE